MIWIFKDRGVPKGDALVTYENNSSASNAVSYFKGMNKMNIQLNNII